VNVPFSLPGKTGPGNLENTSSNHLSEGVDEA